MVAIEKKTYLNKNRTPPSRKQYFSRVFVLLQKKRIVTKVFFFVGPLLRTGQRVWQVEDLLFWDKFIFDEVQKSGESFDIILYIELAVWIQYGDNHP